MSEDPSTPPFSGQPQRAAGASAEESASDVTQAPSARRRAEDVLSRYLGRPLGENVRGDDAFAWETLERLTGRGGGSERYRRGEEIARGGQGVILRVWDEDLRRDLAMKVVHGGTEEPPSGSPVHGTPQANSRSLGRFLEEAQVTGQLDHPGIVPVHELGLDAEGNVYFTMKLVKGRDFKAIIRAVGKGEEGWNRTRALGVVLRVCEAMSYAHAKGVIHRDLKPSNVMVGRFGEVFVMDWGLARVLGRDDRHDMRIRALHTTVSLDTERHHRHGDAESPLYTMDGDVVGTPAYMSPEQAGGDLEGMGPHSDVYSVGAMLYHLLSGRMPYFTGGKGLSNYAVWGLVQQGPPLALHQLAPDVPAELVAICEKAMARAASARYADMAALGEELRAYLEHRVVHAYETGAAAEFRKWVVRNRALAASLAAGLVLVVGALVVISWVQARGRQAAEAERAVALANEERANDNAAEAQRQEALARTERENVLRLAAIQELAGLRAEADELWPIHPERIPAYESWLARAHALVASEASELAFARDQLAVLRARAVPLTAEEHERARRSHPRFEELLRRRAELAARRRSASVMAGSARPASFTVVPELNPGLASELASWAWELVDPKRELFGSEPEGLALARLARERTMASTDATTRANVSAVLAWAYFANGLVEEAFGVLEEARGEAAGSGLEHIEAEIAHMDEELDEASAAGHLEHLAAQIAALEETVEEAVGRSFADGQDRWWHDQLSGLVAGLERFADPEVGLISGISPTGGWGIERRLAHARTMERATARGAPERARWDGAIRSLRDPAWSPAYGGLEIAPQLGLLPIGQDPRSGLWEFAHLSSGTVPERDADGELVLTADAAIILVLLPGGTFWMGAQADDPDGPNYDPGAREAEGPVHRLTLAPFFLGKHELTQAQWKRLTGTNPSTYIAGSFFGGYPLTELHPVEQISWLDCRRTVTRFGLLLPTEAQWEYGTRAGRETPWWPGPELADIDGIVNVGDRTARQAGALWPGIDERLEDGSPVHAPVGTYPPNPFGLHEVHGNVLEWCRDRWGPFSVRPGPGDGLRVPKLDRDPIPRGGSFVFPPNYARSAYRVSWEEEFHANFIGVRAARALRRD